MKRVLGAPYEISLRILLMLSEAYQQSLTLDKIAALDFIAVYAHDFGISESNLHGYSSYRFGEFAGRRELVQNGIKQLVLNGTINVICSENGFEYAITDNGIEFAVNMECAYADAYRTLITAALELANSKSEYSLLEMISKRTVESLREG